MGSWSEKPIRRRLQTLEFFQLAVRRDEELRIPGEDLRHDTLETLAVVHMSAHVGADAPEATIEAFREDLPGRTRAPGAVFEGNLKPDRLKPGPELVTSLKDALLAPRNSVRHRAVDLLGNR